MALAPTSAPNMKALEKQFHKSMGVKVGGIGYEPAQVSRWPTGIFEFDLGTGGGFPRNKLSIIYGQESSAKSIDAMMAIIYAQKVWPDKRHVLFDIEGVYDPVWFKKLGGDPNMLSVFRPDFAEQCGDMMEAMLQAPDCGIVVVDSVAAFMTKLEVQKYTTEDELPGILARVMSKIVGRVIWAMIQAEKTGGWGTVILINQTRIKIGCFSYNARVKLADGTSERIGKIVRQKLPLEVLSMDDQGRLVPRKIVGWADNGRDDQWLDFRVQGGNSGLRKFSVTPGHTIFTPQGEVLAGALKPGDAVLTEGRVHYTDQQHEILLGSLLGDGSLRFEKGSSRGHMRLAHGLAQEPYLRWKANLLGVSVRVGARMAESCTARSLEFSRYEAIKKVKGLMELPEEWVQKLTPLALAVWYLDDGGYSGTHAKWGWGKPSIAAKLLSQNTLDRLALRMARMGAGLPNPKEGQGLTWSGKDAEKFLRTISPYVPSCMAYKVKVGMACGDGLEVARQAPEARVFSEKIVSITPVTRKLTKYDLTIEGEHNYLVDGVVVHNTMYGDPESFPGGNKQRFAACLSIRKHGSNTTKKDFPAQGDGPPFGKKCSAILKKWKCPILATHLEWVIHTRDFDGHGPGYCPTSWHAAEKMLREIGLLTQTKAGWQYDDAALPTLKDWKAAFDSTPQLRTAMVTAILANADIETSQGDIPDEDFDVVDPETGEITPKKALG